MATANAAKADFLAALEYDLDNDGTVDVEAGEAVPANVATNLSNAVDGVDAVVTGDYLNASANVRSALLADQQTKNAKVLAAAEKTLTEAQAEVAKVTGLETAVSNLQSAGDALISATKAQTTAEAAEVGAASTYVKLNGGTANIADTGEVTNLIELNTDDELQLVAGISEANHEGVTALLNAINGHLAAKAAVLSAGKSVSAAESVVNNLDLTADAKSELSDIAVELGLGATATPSVAEITSEIDVRVSELEIAATASDFDVTVATSVNVEDGVTPTESQDLLNSANAYVGTTSDTIEAIIGVGVAANLTSAEITAGESALDTAVAKLKSDIAAAATVAEIQTLIDNAATAKVISATDDDTDLTALVNTTDTDVPGELASTKLALAGANGVDKFNNINEFDTAVAQYAEDNATAVAAKELDDLVGLYDTYTTAAADNERLDALTAAQDAILDGKGTAATADDTGIQAQINALEAAVTNLEDAQATAAQLETLNGAIVAAGEAFTDNDYLVPVSVDGSELATAESDIFLAGNTDASIANFGLLGEDSLFISGATYNSAVIGAGTGEVTLGKAGDDSVIEFFLQETGSGVDVIIEANGFGSSASTPEVTTITLTGAALADVNVDGGFITVA